MSATPTFTNVQWYTNPMPITQTTTQFIITNTTTAISAYPYQGYPGPYGDVKTVEVEAPTKLVPNMTYNMPDGSKVHIDADGGYRIDDKDTKVIYRAARVRDFNPYLNASDLLEKYIEELVPMGVRQDEILHLEMEGFIYWLIHRAAERDGDTPPSDVPRLPAKSKHHFNRCNCCGRFIARALAMANIYFCSPDHMALKLQRIGYGR